MICTFYSYKGGVGRSMALANVGEWLFLRAGLRAVLIDWDLEAPGLEAFFPSDERTPSLQRQPGLIDLLLDYKEDLPYLSLPAEDASIDEVVAALSEQLPPLRSRLLPLRRPVPDSETGSALWILPAGRREGDSFTPYAQAVQRFDWTEFYERYRGEAFFEWLRLELLSDDLADIVLIDTRTGISEMGGVATRQLADVIVTFCVPNTQNIEGVLALTESFVRPDVIKARGRPLQILVVPTRIENSEIDARNLAKVEFMARLDHLRPAAMERERRTFWDLRIPYVPKYAYKEQLAVGAGDSAEELEAAYVGLAVQLLELAPEGGRARERAVHGAGVNPVEPIELPSVDNVPSRNPLVVGRQAQLSEMRARLSETSAPLVLYGLGGVGKSTLANEYCHRFQPDYEVTWWIDAETPESIASGYAALAGQLGIASTPESVRRWLASHRGWLLVFDGADNPPRLAEQIPSERRGHVLITSLNPNWGKLATALEVPMLDRDDSVDLLRRRTGEVDVGAVSLLAHVLGDLPLALEQAAGYMDATGRSTAKYLELFEREGPAVLTRGAQRSPSGESVAAVWERSYRSLLRDRAAQSLLALCSVLAEVDIPLEMFARGAKVRGAEFLFDPAAVDASIVGLRQYSFATMRGGALSVHPLLRGFVREWLGEKQLRHWTAVAVKLMRSALEARPTLDAREASLLVTHADAVADRATAQAPGSPSLFELLAAIVLHLEDQGQMRAARTWMDRAVEQAIASLPAKDPLIDRLARLRLELLLRDGDLDAADAALRSEFDWAHRAGPEALMRVLGDRGVVAIRRGDLDDAEQATREALAIAQSLEPGEELARLMINQAVVRARRGARPEAVQLAVQATKIGEAPPPAVFAVADQMQRSHGKTPGDGLLRRDVAGADQPL